MDQLKTNTKKKPVVINGYKQNCYAVGTMTAMQGIRTIEPETKYESLETVVLPNGYIEKLVEKDYPINSASVTSYADGADYRYDPMQAIAQAPKRVNLGDVTEVQKFIEADPQQAVRVFRDVAKVMEKYVSTKQAQQNNTNGEVNKE